MEQIFYTKESPQMLEAFKKAQSTFKYFWRELYWERRRIVPALNFAFVKMPFMEQDPSGEPIEEFMWVGNIGFDGVTVWGTLDNEPGQLTGVKIGDTVERPLEEISDWMFTITEKTMFSTKNRAYGGFTVHVIRAEMDSKLRKEHDKAWGLDFGNPDSILVAHGQQKNPENLIEHPMSKNMGEKFREFLRQNPSELTHKDDFGYTTLHWEAIAGNKTCAEILLEMGADKTAKTNSGYTAADLAKKLEWDHLIPIL
jgi:uncharacterized protein YegJ (DUF2314 family)